MKIAHVIRRLSFDNWGGTEQVVWNIAKAQKAAGHEVEIFSTTALEPKRDEIREGIRIRRFDAVYPWWPMPKSLIEELDRKGGNPFVPKLARELKRFKPEVIHCHAMARIAELCMRTAKKCGAKCVISLHGGGENIPQVEARSLKAPTRGRLPWGKMIDYLMGWVRRVPLDADGIICVGEDEYFAYTKKHPHVLYLPNGVNAATFARGGVERAKGRAEARTILLTVARIDIQKNQMLLIEYLARHPEAVARFVGPITQPEYKQALESRARELGVEDRVFFVGALKPESDELIQEYKNADIFVLPSRHEPFGITALEAWAAGCKVVASDVGGLGRLCRAHPNAAILFEAGNLDDMEKAIARAQGEEGRKMADSAVKAAQEYDWSKLAARLVDFCRNI